MKTTLFLLCLLSVSFFFVSCDKDSSEDPQYPITGLWIGTYDVVAGAEDADSLYYSFHIADDSTIQVQGLGADGNTYYSLGRWTSQGSSFSANVETSNLTQQGVVQKITASQDDDELVGTVETTGAEFRAAFRLKRVN